MNQSHLMQLLKEKLDHARAHRIVVDMLATFIDFAEVLSSKLVEGKAVRYELDDAPPREGDPPQIQEVYSGQAGFLSRVQDGAEVVYWRSGSESIVIATKDRRFEVALEKGEVVMHNMPSDPTKQSTIRITNAGDIEIHTHPGGEVRIGDADATSAVALADKVNGELEKIQETLASLGGNASFAKPYETRLTVDASKVKAM